MNPVLLNILMGVLTQMPAIANDVKSAVAAAESPEAGQAKAKEILTDGLKVLSVIADAL